MIIRFSHIIYAVYMYQSYNNYSYKMVGKLYSAAMKNTTQCCARYLISIALPMENCQIIIINVILHLGLHKINSYT